MERQLARSLVYLRPVEVVLVRARGPYADAVNKAWGRMFAWMDAHGLGAEVDIGYGLAHDDPRAVGPEACRYDACIPVPETVPPHALHDLQRLVLPSGVYARDLLTRSYDGMGHRLSAIRDEWVPRNGLVVDARRPVVTIYRNNPRYCPPEMLKADICLPIVAPAAAAAAGPPRAA